MHGSSAASHHSVSMQQLCNSAQIGSSDLHEHVARVAICRRRLSVMEPAWAHLGPLQACQLHTDVQAAAIWGAAAANALLLQPWLELWSAAATASRERGSPI